MNRRDVIQKVLLGTTALIVIPTAFTTSCSKDPSIPGGNNGNNNPPPAGTKITLDLTLPENSVLNTTGGSKIVQSLIVVNTGGGAFVALSSICTHQGCTVDYSSANSRFVCPCHGSAFALTGSVINGPAASALQSYPALLSGTTLTITV